MLKRVGRDGMSSDESSEGEGGLIQSRVLIKDWRSYRLTRWLKDLDHRPEAGRGDKPRFRFASDKVQRGTNPVKGLPRSAYSAQWLNSLSNYAIKELAIDETDYHFRKGVRPNVM